MNFSIEGEVIVQIVMFITKKFIICLFQHILSYPLHADKFRVAPGGIASMNRVPALLVAHLATVTVAQCRFAYLEILDDEGRWK